jgi:hypothetical protein
MTIPQSDDKEISIGTKFVFGVVGVALAVVILGLFLVIFTRDTWERDNGLQIFARLEEAKRIQETDPLAAYKALEAILTETRQHSIKGEQLSQELHNAEETRDVLLQKVQKQIQAEQEAKEREEAAEKQRIAEQQKRDEEAMEARRVAEEQRKAEEKRRSVAVSIYRNPPESARSALNAVKRVEARTEVGINYRDYSALVGDAWADVKIFIESPDGKRLQEFSSLLAKAMDEYRLALEIWNDKIQYPRLYGERSDVDALQQVCWMKAGERLELAESLLDETQIATTLESIAKSKSSDKETLVLWKEITDKILNRN